MVDPKLAALALYPLLWRHGLPLNLLRISRIGLNENQLADVVQKGGGRQPVARVVIQLPGKAIACKPRSARVQAKAVRDLLPDRGALEEVERLGAIGNRVHRPGRENLDGIGDALDLAAAASRQMICQPQYRDRQRHVRFDGGDDLARRGLTAGEQGQQPLARLGEDGKALERLKGSGETPAMALVVAKLARGARIHLGGAVSYSAAHGWIACAS